MTYYSVAGIACIILGVVLGLWCVPLAPHLNWIRRKDVPLDANVSRPFLDAKHRQAPVTLFYAGLFSSIRQAARYTGGLPVAGYYNERSSALLYNVMDDVTWVEPWTAEYNKDRVPWYYQWPTQLYQHLALWYHGTRPFPASETAIPLPYVCVGRANFAQEGDVYLHGTMLARLNFDFAAFQRPIILFGSSNGASTTLNSVLLMHQTRPERLRNVKAVIIEAPYSDLDEVLEHLYGPWLSIPARWMLATVTQYRPPSLKGKRPIDAAAAMEWPLHIPLLIVASKSDKVVPPSQTAKLAALLRAKNPGIDVTECYLNHSTHGTMSIHNDEDVAHYRRVMLDFIKRALPDSPADLWLA